MTDELRRAAGLHWGREAGLMEGTEAGRDALPSERQRWDPRRSVG